MATKNSKSPVAVGNSVFIRGVAMYYTGRIVEVSPDEIIIEDAAWIADTGRFSLALRGGNFNEVEPYPPGPISILRASVLDISLWPHALPREAK